MPLDKNIQEKISLEVIKVLHARFNNFPDDATSNRNAPFHESFLKAFNDRLEGKVQDIPYFISLSSWLHGLNTTLGQTFFEKVAQILSGGEKRDYTSGKNTLLKITHSQKSEIAEIITELKNGNKKPDCTEENKRIFVGKGDHLIEANSFTADVFFEDEKKVTAIELKSVKPNAGEMRSEKQKILEAKAALYKEFPTKEVYFYMGFPFDPTSKSSIGFNKVRFLNSIIDASKYFEANEIKLSSELWDFLAGEKDTMKQILDIINVIATPKFMERYFYINHKSNRKTQEYLNILNEWNLFSEEKIIKNEKLIHQQIEDSNIFQRIFNQQIFKEGVYNWHRFNKLNSLISKR